MKQVASIQYRDFYDVPRIFITQNIGQVFLFDCPFDENKDEYASEYSVFLMPTLAEGDLTGDWTKLSSKATRLLGKIPVADVQFDSTKRKQVNLEILTKLDI